MCDIAVIGAGNWGSNHIRTFAQEGRLGAIFDIDMNSIEKAIQSDKLKNIPLIKNIPKTDDWNRLERLIESGGIKGAAIATPIESHFDNAKWLLERGVHVLVEKPFTETSIQARELIEIAKRRELVIAVGHLMLHFRPIKVIKAMISSNRIGNLKYIQTNRLGLGIIREKENAMWSCAPHDLSIINHIVGESPIGAKVAGSLVFQPKVHDVVVAHLDYPDQIKSHIHVSWFHPFKETRLFFKGDKGIIYYEDREYYDDKTEKMKKATRFELHNFELIDNGKGPVFKRNGIEILPIPEDRPLTTECQDFLRCMDNCGKPVATGEDGLITIRILEQLQESLVDGGRYVELKY